MTTGGEQRGGDETNIFMGLLGIRSDFEGLPFAGYDLTLTDQTIGAIGEVISMLAALPHPELRVLSDFNGIRSGQVHERITTGGNELFELAKDTTNPALLEGMHIQDDLEGKAERFDELKTAAQIAMSEAAEAISFAEVKARAALELTQAAQAQAAECSAAQALLVARMTTYLEQTGGLA